MPDERLIKLMRLLPNPVKRLARRILPAATAERIHERSARVNYVPWMVSREQPLTRTLKRAIGRKPHLHRLVVHLTDHCNLNCKGCSHFSNIAEPTFVEPGDFGADVERLSHIFSGITEIYLLGGEPLLHPDVTRFLESARAAFPASRVNLLTNGVLVTRMSDAFWRSMRDNRIWLMCNLYPIKLPTDRIEEMAKTWDVRLEWMDPRGEFFKLPIDLTGSQDAEDSFRRCGTINNCVTLRDHRLYPCAYAAYGDILARRFDLKQLEPGESDSIGIDASHSHREIFDFLCKPVSWCRYCDVEHTSTYEWGRGTGELGEWTACGPTGGSTPEG